MVEMSHFMLLISSQEKKKMHLGVNRTLLRDLEEETLTGEAECVGMCMWSSTGVAGEECWLLEV